MNANEVDFSSVKCTAETKLAVLCLVDGKETWIPKSVISDDSEVYEKGHEGTLIVAEWFAALFLSVGENS